MTIQKFIKQGHKWIELKGVPVRDSHSEAIMYIHNKFFEGKELEFQNEVLSHLMEVCPDRDWNHRVYGGDTPDANMVSWIYTQTAEIVIADPEGREFQDFTTWNGMTVKAEDLEKWTKFFAEGISNKVSFGGKESTYKHNAGCITVKVAYTNDNDKPEDMSYCVSWYRWKDTENEKAEIVECENGVSIWQAARAMADFHLLADKVGFATIEEILNPCERNVAVREKGSSLVYMTSDFDKLIQTIS